MGATWMKISLRLMDSKGVGSPKKPTPSVDDQTLPSVRTSALDSLKGAGLATLEPYIPLGDTKVPKRKLEGNSRNNAKSSRKTNNNEYEIVPGILVPNTFDKYLTITLENPPECIFNVHRDIVKCCGRKPKISAQNNGHLLVEVNSSEESDKLKNLSSLGGISAKCHSHSSLNSSKGLIYAPQLITYSEEKLQKEFEDQGVLRVQRIKKKIDGAITPQPGLILTFNSIRLPSSIEAAWYTYKVKPFIPRPRRCFHCQEFGHTLMSCRLKTQGRPAVCVICSDEEHGNCNKDPKCYHCGGNHPSSSTSCDVYLFEKEVQATRIKERITFAEAKQQVKLRFIRPGVSFATMLMESVVYKKNKKQQVSKQRVDKLPNGMKNKPAKRALSRESSEDSIQVAQSSQFSVVSPLLGRKGHSKFSPASQEAALYISTTDVEIHVPMEAESDVADNPASVKDAPVSGASASLEAAVAVLDAATSLDGVPRKEMESGIPNAVGVTDMKLTPEKADQQASNQVTPIVSEASSFSGVVPPQSGSDDTIKVSSPDSLPLGKKKKETPLISKPQRVIKTSVPSPQRPYKSGKDKEKKVKLKKSSLT